MFLTVAALAIAGAHAYWGLGGLWPEKNEANLARAVVGDGRTRMPAPWQCHAVAAALLVVAAWPWAIILAPENNLVLTGGIVIGAIFFLRGLAGYSPRWRMHFSDEPFATRDRRVYAPLCLTIGVGFGSLMAQGM